MTNGNGVSRGDRNRNARLARLRELVPLENAIVGIDLADKKQMVVVTDHDSKVLAQRTFRCRAWDLGVALDWAAERATANGFAGATLSCEPTGHRWRVLGQLAADRSMPFVCAQPMQTSWARRSEDLTFDKTDDRLVVDKDWSYARAAERFSVSVTTARRWAGRYRELGKAGMLDRSSRPHRSPNRLPQRRERRIVKLRVTRRWGRPGSPTTWA